MIKRVLILPILFFSLQVYSQADDVINRIIENLAQETESSNADFTLLLENLNYYSENKINLNDASSNQLKSLRLLNDYQISQLFLYTHNNGELTSFYELNQIEGLDREIIMLLSNFSEIKPKPKIHKKSFHDYLNGKNQLIIRHSAVLADQIGFLNDSTGYLGSKDKAYMRYNYKSREGFSAGFTFEKDAGETWLVNGTPDFTSAHVQIKEIGNISNFILGDYSLEIGQGLGMWSGFGARKSYDLTTQTKQFARGAVPYTASDENRFLRGASASAKIGKTEFTGFYSSKKIDARLDDNQTDFSSFPTAGTHRTESELEIKDKVIEQTYGGILNYTFKSLDIGLYHISTSYNKNKIIGSQLYQQFDFAGNEIVNHGGYYNFLIDKFNFYGEVSTNNFKDWASLNGLTIYANERLTFNALYRNYSPRFNALYGEGFGERSGNKNEKGLYLSASFLPISNVSVEYYFDQYQFPWLTFQTDKPSTGFDHSVFLKYSPKRNIQFGAIFRTESKEKGAINSELAGVTSFEKVDQYRLYVHATINQYFKIKTRIDKKIVSQEDYLSKGSMLITDFHFTLLNNKMQFIFRYAIFDTDDYNSRIYAYEPDMRYQFTVPAFYESGFRNVFLIKYKALDNLDFYFKLSMDDKPENTSIGSGLNEIKNTHRTEAKTQLIIKF